MATVLQINSVAATGSTGRIAEQIGALAVDSGWHSVIAYGRRAGESRSELWRVGDCADVWLHGALTRLTDRHCFFSREATESFLKEVERLQPDIIHLHNIHGYYLHAGLLFDFLAQWGGPVVWTLHDCWPFTGHCAHYDAVGCSKWRDGCNRCPQRREYPASWVCDSSARNYDDKRRLFTSLRNLILVPVSDWLARQVSESFLGGFPIETIGNGVDLSTFAPREGVSLRNSLGITSDEKMLLGVASVWSRRKGLDDLVGLAQMLPDRFKMVLVGLNESQIRSLPSRITGVGAILSAEQLTQYYSAADVVMNLSREETFGLTTVEGMACGTPSIVYDATASPELITPETGAVVPCGDLQALSTAVESVTRCGKSCFATPCRTRAEERYDSRKCYANYMKLYNRLLKQ